LFCSFNLRFTRYAALRAREVRMESTKTIRVPDRLLTPEQAAELLGLSKATLATWRASRKVLPFVRVGSKAVRYSEEAIREYARRNQVTCA
jgi:excisionase family DNA binding protein